VVEFVAEVDRYVRSGAANLQEQRLFSLGSTAWLGDPGGRSNPAVIRTLQAFGGEPCILPDVFVRVPMQALLALRGSTPKGDPAEQQEAAPLCAGFSPVAR
jgi:hypothetical protein